VGCSHAAGCPLFPLLRESLRGWRDYYCDSNDQWLGCARYRMSLTGEGVPISLLPNGAHVRHFEDAATGRGQASRQARPERHAAWSAEGASGSQQWASQQWASQQWPAQQSAPATPAGRGVAGPDSVTPWATAPPSIPLTQARPAAPPQNAQPYDRSTRHAPQAPGPRRGWMARLADWMRRPA
jgi:hypothetical protein